MEHPNFFTINLLKNLILSAPITFPAARKSEMLKRVDAYLADPLAPLEQIKETVINFGKELWPYRASYEKIYEQYGRKPEEEKIASFLSKELKEKYKKFLEDRGNIEKMKSDADWEIYFAPTEQAAMVEAELKAHDEIHADIQKMILGSSQAEYQALLEQYKNEERQIEERLGQLEKIAGRAPDFAEEIAGKVEAFKEGFGYLDRPVALADVQTEVDYYLGVAGIET